MTRELSPPTPALAAYVRHIMAGGFPSQRVHLPACHDVQLLVYLRGGATLIDPAGGELRLEQVFLVGAVTHPRVYRVDPGSRFIAVTFRPGGIYACFGIPADQLTGRILPFHGTGAMLQALRRISDGQALRRLQSMLEHGLAARAGWQSGLPPLDLDTLTQSAPILARQLGIGVRQLERRCLVSLGMPLRDYRRLARYSTAMTALMMQGGSPQDLAGLALQAGYVDQAHFTRDFNGLVGHPPGRFLRQRTDAQYQLWQFTSDELESYLDTSPRYNP